VRPSTLRPGRYPLERRTPKYQVIAADLTAKIRGGRLAPGTALPPQKELSAVYGVTLVTLRQALRRLEDDGLVSQQPGRGTFVAEPRVTYRLDSLRGLAEDLRAQGQTVSTEILGQSLRRPPAWVAAELAGPEKVGGAEKVGSAEKLGSAEKVGSPEKALRLERLRLLAGRPAVHQLSWVRGPAGEALATADLSGTSLYAAIAEQNVVVHRATEVVRPGLLDEASAALLRQPAGTPVFISDRITFGLDDAPIVFDRATILGTMMEIRTERAATGLSMQWTRQT
jgi:GntR family transcriptional regulator